MLRRSFMDEPKSNSSNSSNNNRSFKWLYFISGCQDDVYRLIGTFWLWYQNIISKADRANKKFWRCFNQTANELKCIRIANWYWWRHRYFLSLRWSKKNELHPIWVFNSFMIFYLWLWKNHLSIRIQYLKKWLILSVVVTIIVLRVSSCSFLSLNVIIQSDNINQLS